MIFNYETRSIINEFYVETYRDALPVLKSLDGSCEHTRLAALALLTVKPEVFGDAQEWTSADVSCNLSTIQILIASE